MAEQACSFASVCSRSSLQYHRIRGVVLIESAASIGFVITLFCAIFTLGMLGLKQLAVDASAMNDARASSYGDTYYALTVFPFSQQTSNVARVSYTDSDPRPDGIQWDNHANQLRDIGSATLARTFISETTRTHNWSFGIPFIGQYGGMLEGVDTGQKSGLTTWQSYDNRGGVGTSPSQVQIFHTEVGAQIAISRCSQVLPMARGQRVPNGVSAVPYVPHWSTCPNTPTTGNSYSTMGIGNAVRLDDSNIRRGTPGVEPRGRGAGGAVFWEVLYHQQVFANAVLQLKTITPAMVSRGASWNSRTSQDALIDARVPAVAQIYAEFDKPVSGLPSNWNRTAYQVADGTYR